MGKAGVWGAIGWLVVAGCGKSEPASDWAAACYAARELESWDQRFDDACSVETDFDADGDIDARTDFVFDDEGRKVAELAEWSDVEIVVRRWEYDDDGRLSASEFYGADGQLTPLSEVEYDGEGRVSVLRRDYDGDGAVDDVRTYDYACLDELGLSPEQEFCSVSHDADGDGDVDGVSTTTFNDDGEPVERELFNTSGELTRTTYSYEERDGARFQVMEVDDEDDGVIDMISGTEWDASGTMVATWQDFGADGTIDSSVEEMMIGNRSITIHRGADGEVLCRDEAVHGEGGRLLRVSSRCPSSPSFDADEVYLYDAAGNLVATAQDSAPLGSADECGYRSYDCLARRTQ